MPSIVTDCYADMAQRLIDAQAEIEQLRKALQQMTDAYTALVHSGDCGHWNPELDPPVVDARILLPDPLAVTQQEKTP
jgi:hypothetical protein